MIPYGCGFDHNGCPIVDIQIDFKKLGRSCKALARKVSRSAGRRLQKR